MEEEKKENVAVEATATPETPITISEMNEE